MKLTCTKSGLGIEAGTQYPVLSENKLAWVIVIGQMEKKVTKSTGLFAGAPKNGPSFELVTVTEKQQELSSDDALLADGGDNDTLSISTPPIPFIDYKQYISDLRTRYSRLLAAIKQPDLYGIIESLEALGMTPSDLPLDEPVWPSRAIPLRRAIETLMIEADMEADKLEKQLVSMPPKPSQPFFIPSIHDSAKILRDGLERITAQNDAMIAATLARRASLAPVTVLAEPQTEVTVTKIKAPTKRPKQENLVTVTETTQDSQPVEPVELVTVTQIDPQPEQAKPKRPRGRPASGNRPMTPAEKQAAYRARHKMKKVTVTFDRSDADELLTYLTAVAGGITFPLDKQLATRLRDACQSAWVGQLVSDATSSTDA